MKKLLFGFLLAASFGLASCGGDECYDCTSALLPAQSFCDGDTLLQSVSASDFASGLELGGYTCTKK